MAKVTRKETWDMFDSDWCPNCAKIVKMKRINTEFIGIVAQQCPECGNHYEVNYLEDGEDIMEIPDSFVIHSVWNVKRTRGEE